MSLRATSGQVREVISSLCIANVFDLKADLSGLVLGARSFGRKSLHYIGTTPNPYQQAIAIIGKTLSVFDEDNLIPCYGFGDGNKPVKTRSLFLDICD